jgi:coenzyme F420-reducing hydrogenase beta subunit
MSSLENDEKLPICFAAYNPDEETRSLSSSGGVFSAMATAILADSGVVYGAAFNKNWELFHTVCEKNEDLSPLVGSKYIMSNLKEIFVDVKLRLESNQQVLFIGAGCQVAGLKNFLKNEFANLLCVDFFCLGTAKPDAWRDYLNSYWKEKVIHSINFKDKSAGWHRFSVKIVYTNKNESKLRVKITRGMKHPFMLGYFLGLYTTEACNTCRFHREGRVSDITIADFWGIEKSSAAKLDDDRGVSAVQCHTQKGLDFFHKIQPNLTYQVVTYDETVRFNSETENHKRIKHYGEGRGFFNKYYGKIPFKLLLESIILYFSIIEMPRKMFALTKRLIRKIKE